jgi:hypothetical protein
MATLTAQPADIGIVATTITFSFLLFAFAFTLASFLAFVLGLAFAPFDPPPFFPL